MFIGLLKCFSINSRGIRASATDGMPDHRGKEFPVHASSPKGPGLDIIRARTFRSPSSLLLPKASKTSPPPPPPSVCHRCRSIQDPSIPANILLRLHPHLSQRYHEKSGLLSGRTSHDTTRQVPASCSSSGSFALKPLVTGMLYCRSL